MLARSSAWRSGGYFRGMDHDIDIDVVDEDQTVRLRKTTEEIVAPGSQLSGPAQLRAFGR
jgi:hypothetical protein